MVPKKLYRNTLSTAKAVNNDNYANEWEFGLRALHPQKPTPKMQYWSRMLYTKYLDTLLFSSPPPPPPRLIFKGNVYAGAN